MKKLTNKQRCRNCIHRTVCKYFGAYDGLDWLGDRCKHYKPRVKKGANDESKDKKRTNAL